MQYSPKLKTAMAEIDKILADNDIAGLVVLHDVGFSEYLLKINTSYSVVSIDNGSEEIHFRAKLQEDFNGDHVKMKYNLGATSNMLNLLANRAGTIVVALIETSVMFDAMMGATHTPGMHTSQQEIDN